MVGKGYETSKDDDISQSSDDDQEKMSPTPKGFVNSPNGRRRRDIFDDDSHEANDDESVKQSDNGESDTESENGESDTDSDDGSDSNSDSSKYICFQQFYDEIMRIDNDKEGKYMTIDQRRKRFRNMILEVIKTYFGLKKDPVFKKIMETVRDLRSGPGGYDMTEVLALAILPPFD